MSLTAILGLSISVATALWRKWIYNILKNDKVDSDKAAKLIDIGKWSIATVAIVIASAFVSDSFKERNQDISELTYFDKYVNVFIETEGMVKKWNLVEYLCSVAPEGALKESWEKYKETLAPKYKEYIGSRK